MTVMKIAEALQGTRFAENLDLIAKIRKHLISYGEAHLFDGGSDFDYRTSHDRHVEDKSNGEHWLVVSFFDSINGYPERVVKPVYPALGGGIKR
jgi:hypothetical protein